MNGNELKKLGTVEEIELTTEEENMFEKERYAIWDSSEFSCEFQINPESVKDIRKHIVYGGDRGRYNGYVLRRDGYLSPENAWFGKDKILVDNGKYYTQD